MCKADSNHMEIRLALQQLQALVSHVEQSIIGWKQVVIQSSTVDSHLDWDIVVKDADNLFQSLQQLEHQLAEGDGRQQTSITITPFK